MAKLAQGDRGDLEAMLGVFEHTYGRSVPFREDRELLVDLLGDVRPVLDALSLAIRADPTSEHVHEAFALVTLLSRRAALLGATPTAAHALARALFEGLAATGHEALEGLSEKLVVVAFEGYVAGHEERTTGALKQALANSQVSVSLAPRCEALFLTGRHDPELLAPVLEEHARRALRRDIASLLLDISRLEVPDEQLARVLFDALATFASLGLELIVYSPGDTLRPFRERFHRAAEGALFTSSSEEAMRRALAGVGYELRARGRRWPKDLFSRSR